MPKKKEIDLKLLAKLAADNKSDAEIAKILGAPATKDIVRDRRNSLGIKASQQKVDILLDYKDDILRMGAQKVPIPRQARILGVSPRRIERARGRLHLSRPAQTPVSEENKKRIKAMLDSGASYSEVHRTTGVSRRWIVNHYPNQGWSAKESAEYRHALQKAREAGIDL